MKLMVVAIILLSASSAASRKRCRRCRSVVSLPVCGSDGNVYKSKCELLQWACRKNKKIEEVTCPKQSAGAGSDGSRSSNKNEDAQGTGPHNQADEKPYVGFAIDGTYVNGYNFLQQYAYKIFKLFPPGSSASVITYGNTPDTRMASFKKFQDVTDFKHIKYMGGLQKHNTGAAIEKYIKLFDEVPTTSKKVLFVITTAPADDEFTEQAKKISDKGVSIIAIGIESKNIAQLKDMARYYLTAKWREIFTSSSINNIQNALVKAIGQIKPVDADVGTQTAGNSQSSVASSSGSKSSGGSEGAQGTGHHNHNQRFKCPSQCPPTIVNPVCGDDDKLYMSPCELRKQKCKVNPNIQLRRCSAEQCSKMDCSTIRPKVVCGSDGKIYQNDCEFMKASCIKQSQNRQRIFRRKCEGASSNPDNANGVSCNKYCSNDYKPVCGNGKMYLNSCWKKQQECKIDRIINSQRCNREHCKTLDCPTEKHEVCDADGNRYDNYCELRKISCIRQKRIRTKKCEGASSNPDNANGVSCNKDCSNDYKPVCGDRKMYLNSCWKKQQECKIDRIITSQRCSLWHCKTLDCPTKKQEVCDADGNRYDNYCELRKKYSCTQNGIRTKKCPGASSKPDNANGVSCNNYCSNDYKPVCGNGKMYLNSCWKKEEECIISKIINSQRCSLEHCKAMDCPPDKHEVCDVDGKRYDNYCVLKKMSCITQKRIRTKKCPGPSRWCPTKCKDHTMEVCGNNNKRYRNGCFLRMDACQTGKVILPQKCQTVVDRCDDECPTEGQPVCSIDGRKFQNQCEIKKAACREKRRSIQTEECTGCHAWCTKELVEVCGSDGKTYNNKCLLNVAACFQKEKDNHKPEITLDKVGKC